MTKGGSLGNVQYCKIRSTATIVVSSVLAVQISLANVLLRFNPYVIATPAKPIKRNDQQ